MALISQRARQKAVLSHWKQGRKRPIFLTDDGKKGVGRIPPEKNIIIIESVNNKRMPV